MLRKLLACLALLTGLAAAGVPAQAEVASSLASQLEASASVQTVERGVAATTLASLASRPEGELLAPVALAAGRTLAAPTVCIGSDRARE